MAQGSNTGTSVSTAKPRRRRTDPSSAEFQTPAEQQKIDMRRRVAIEDVHPEIDAGRFPIKRVPGEKVLVRAAIFADGHDLLACRLLYWEGAEPEPRSLPMDALGNDLWQAEFHVTTVGRCRYTVEGWIDRFGTWRADLLKRIAAEQKVPVELLIGAELIENAATHVPRDQSASLLEWARRLRGAPSEEAGKAIVLEEELLPLLREYPDPNTISRYEKELEVVVDRTKALFSTWYEIFPRSCSPVPGRHGTFKDCEGWLPYISSMGFDVVYLPPIHPIGLTFRKGKNNSPVARPEDVGSPWAIGSEEGGHKSVLPLLGTIEDFRRFIGKAAEHGLEVALDIAFQCSPDHPYVREHPEWFRSRPDGTIQYAENPPKKYEDIYPLNFESPDAPALMEELKGVFEFWIEQGVRIFRVDNPHTKPFRFWQWAIEGIKLKHADVIFLAEAFTRPHVMYRLAKLGFTQSYTYFTWRNTKQEFIEYFTELNQPEVREYFRPNLWPNTPDILSGSLQMDGRAAFMMRFLLAATLGSNYGIYGPAFELCENAPFAPGSEEYLNSEKYEIKVRDLNAPWSLKSLIARVNQIRKDNPALQNNLSLRFHETDNPMLLCYSKTVEDHSDVIIIVVNLDPFHPQAGWVNLDLSLLGIDAGREYQAHDLLGGGRFLWKGPKNYVELIPESLPAHILRVRRWDHSERNFDYYS